LVTETTRWQEEGTGPCPQMAKIMVTQDAMWMEILPNGHTIIDRKHFTGC